MSASPLMPTPSRDAAGTLGRRHADAQAKQTDGRVQRSGWQREMERAQAATWFHAPAAAAADNATASAGGQPDKLARRVVEPSRGLAAKRAETSPPALALRAAMIVRTADAVASTAAPANSPVTGATTLPQERGRTGAGGQPEAALRQELRQALRAMTVRSATATPVAEGDWLHCTMPDAPDVTVRVHCENCTDGMVVWLGVQGDASGVARIAADVLVELRQAWARGPQRLVRLICNGQLAWSAAREGVSVDIPNSSSGSDPESAGISHPKEL